MKEKPLSPHLGIYKPQVTSVFSILHRITGAGLYFTTIFLFWSFILINNSSGKDSGLLFDFFLSKPAKFLIGAWIFAIIYHLCSGIRYLFWDMGLGFDLKTINITAAIIVIASVLITAISCYFIFF